MRRHPVQLATVAAVALAATGSCVPGESGIFGAHSCVATGEGAVWCWGFNYNGQVGDGSRYDRPRPVPVAALDGVAVHVVTGDRFTCALLAGGAVRCWGRNRQGQLGDGTFVRRERPAQVLLSAPAAAIAAGVEHACAVVEGGSVACWGANAAGEPGNPSASPIAVAGLSGAAVAVAAGDAFTCALLADGTVACWGRNFFGQLGDGTSDDHPDPRPVMLAGRAVALDAGRTHACAVVEDGSVWCWGETDQVAVPPRRIDGLPPVVAVDAGNGHTCAIDGLGAVWCWGWNFAGQLGDGTRDERSAPASVTGLSGPAVSVSAGDAHTCAALASGAVACWGSNYAGELGDPGVGLSPVPRFPAGLTGARSVAAGASYGDSRLYGCSADPDLE